MWSGSVPIVAGVPCAVGATSDLVSASTGSVLIDGAAGALAGYFLAPPPQRLAYAAVGGALTALGGLFGLALLGVYIVAKR